MATAPVAPHVVIFGALGDLSSRKLLPAIFQLSAEGNLCQNHVVLGVDLDRSFDNASFSGNGPTASWPRRACCTVSHEPV